MFVRKQPRNEVKIQKESNAQEKPPMERSSSENQSLREELDRVKVQLALSQVIGEYTANEKKIISAIKSETINQNTDIPIITRSMFMKKYRVSSRFIDSSIKNLIAKKEINREER